MVANDGHALVQTHLNATSIDSDEPRLHPLLAICLIYGVLHHWLPAVAVYVKEDAVHHATPSTPCKRTSHL
ncbi:hypothetical protein HaLaN_20916 [Haematococcus lacustris]|uniref:Uncharacterized protein n=1 Tax=Haematococcus lacustris TaxID=44745 RepID=A0A699ZUM6_HAELA|nr:hypothetical protein HaLaN_20916 [Haematococcus lacustris]